MSAILLQPQSEAQCVKTQNIILFHLHLLHDISLCSSRIYKKITTILCVSGQTHSVFFGSFSRGQFWPSGIVAACICVCVCVCPFGSLSVPCPCVNHELVCVITRDLFKLGSPNLDQRCKTPWLRSLLFWGQWTLTFKVKFNFEVVCMITHHPFKLGSLDLDQGCKTTWLRSLLFCWGNS